MRFLRRAALFLPLLLLICTCRKSTVTSWDSDLVFPVVSSKLNIRNFLGDSLFATDQTGLLHLAVTRTITALRLDSLIELPDTTITNSFTVPCIPQCTFAPGETIPYAPTTELTFSIGNGVALKRADIKSGFIRVRYTNDTKQPINVIYKIPSVTKNGQALTFSETVPKAPDSLIKIYDLSGYSFNMRGLSGNKYNTIYTTFTMQISPAATAIDTVSFAQGAHVRLNYYDIVPGYLEGYFGQQNVVLPLDTTKLDIWKSFEASNFMLSDAKLNFRIINEFGAEFTSSLSNIKSINSGTTVTLVTPQLSNININAATRSGSIVFPSVKTISLNAGNSNIVPFLSNIPDELTYQGNVNLNPLGNISGYNNFAYYGTGIKVVSDIDIPLRFTAGYFRLSSDTKVDFSNIERLDKINHGKLIVNASNGYPFGARLQAYLLNEANKITDSLFVPASNLIEKGMLDVNNLVTFPTRSSLEIPVDRAKLENLRAAKTIRLVATFLMPVTPPDIKLQDSYVFDVNIVAELNYRIERK